VPGVLQVVLVLGGESDAVHHRIVGKVLEGRFGSHAVFTPEGGVPDGEGVFKGVAVNRDGEQSLVKTEWRAIRYDEHRVLSAFRLHVIGLAGKWFQSDL
jgi:hypothetical protein